MLLKKFHTECIFQFHYFPVFSMLVGCVPTWWRRRSAQCFFKPFQTYSMWTALYSTYVFLPFSLIHYTVSHHYISAATLFPSSHAIILRNLSFVFLNMNRVLVWVLCDHEVIRVLLGWFILWIWVRKLSHYE